MNKILRVKEKTTGDIVTMPDINSLSEGQRKGQVPFKLINSNRTAYIIDNEIVYEDYVRKSHDDAAMDSLKAFLKQGGGIHIKKANRGKFTAAAKRAGMSVQLYASKVLNDPKASPKLKKRANFARNAAKWHHEKGGKVKYTFNTVSGKEKFKKDLIDHTPNMTDSDIWWAYKYIKRK